MAAVLDNDNTEIEHCELCDVNDITHKCEECNQWICEGCYKLHLKGNLTKDHNVRPLADLNNESKALLEHEAKVTKQKMEAFRNKMKTAQNALTAAKRVECDAFKTLKNLRDACIKEINAYFEKMAEKIQTYANQNIDKKETEIIRYEHLLAQMEGVSQEIEKLLRVEDKPIDTDTKNVLQKAKRIIKPDEREDVKMESLSIQVQKGDDWNVEKVLNIRLGEKNEDCKTQTSSENKEVRGYHAL